MRIKAKMKLPRKLKKRIIQVFGRGTYYGIRDGYLMIRKYHKNHGVIIHRTKKLDKFYIPGQRHPRLIFPNIN